MDLPSSFHINPTLDCISIYIVGTAVLMMAITGIWKFIVGSIRRLRKFDKMLTEIETLGPVVLGIAKEFKNNNGSSLKDKIDKITLNVEQASRVAEASEELAKIAREFAQRDHLILQKLPCMSKEDCAFEKMKDVIAKI